MKFLLTALYPIIVLALLIAGVNKLEQVACNASWADSGFPVQYSFLGGCRIQTPDGKWIPADNYREVK